jgi:hypothetical protein
VKTQLAEYGRRHRDARATAGAVECTPSGYFLSAFGETLYREGHGGTVGFRVCLGTVGARSGHGGTVRIFVFAISLQRVMVLALSWAGLPGLYVSLHKQQGQRSIDPPVAARKRPDLSFAYPRRSLDRATEAFHEDLRGADLQMAFLHYAQLQGANLEGAHLAGASLVGTHYNLETVPPQPGFDWAGRGALRADELNGGRG